ncbi:MAG TPA: MMPL family transporter [Solirubrobacterales bacterium]|nr:MMPL family transporter [Solirubrobacterales bacterium]
MLARLIVALRYLIVPAWIAAAIWVSFNLPSIFGSEASELGSLLPRNSKAIEVEEEAIETFGLPVLSRTMVVAHEPDEFSRSQGEAAARFIRRVDEEPERTASLRAVPLLDAPGLLESKRLGSTLVVYLYVDPALREPAQAEVVDRFASELQQATRARSVHVTGAVPASRAETKLADEYLLWVELATVLVVVAILALYFRSIGIPLLGLGTVAIAYQVADHALGWASERYSISIPREVDPVIIALLFGILTDYLVFFASDYRRRLQEGLDSCSAVRKVTTDLLPVILTAALMIAGATLTLLLSGVRFLAAFGPGMAVAVVVGAAVALTFIPAMLAIFGRILLWPSRAHRETRGTHPGELGARGRLVGFAARHPAIVMVFCLALLVAAASGLRKLELGNPIISGLPSSTDARKGYEVAAGALGPGVVGPTMLVLSEPGIGARERQLAALQVALGEREGVAEVIGPVMEPGSSHPYGVLVSENGGAARYVLVLSADPDGARATAILAGLEDEMPGMLEEAGLGGAEAGLTGDTSITAELNSDTWSALARVAPAALLVLLVLLWALLRSRAAPLYLVGVSVLVVAAALGLTVYLFQGLLGYEELAFFVPLATAILLLALGADYNVFLISRIWNEAERQDLRPAIRTAGSRAARAITVAGMILALSFAAVALIPIQAFRELAFAMFIGLLLDTLLARTLLIPALVSLFGRD